MVLAALEFGIGSCWVSRFEVKRLSELLALPKGLLSSEILLFGYPASPKKSASKSLLKKSPFEKQIFGKWVILSILMPYLRSSSQNMATFLACCGKYFH
ncbi:MAG: hypothetical protein NTW32_25025, partial [Chloroflexi bacterium]|nr:hypothetical protein [Chloroflexota bacterium]